MEAEKRKFTIKFSRTVQTRPYETMNIGLIMEYYEDEVSKDYAYTETSKKVKEWMNNELLSMGCAPR